MIGDKRAEPLSLKNTVCNILKMNKKELNEQEIRTQVITPAIQKASWLPIK